MLFRSRHHQDPVSPIPASLSPHDRGTPSDSPGGDQCCPVTPAGPDLTSFSKIKFLQTLSHFLQRKDCVLSPHKAAATGHTPDKTGGRSRGRAFFLTSSAKAVLTAEAAIELPFFLICMVVVLHYCVVCRAAVEFSDGLCQTAEEMAIVAYKEEYGDANNIIRGAISDAYARANVINRAPDADSVKNATFLNSSYMKEGDRIRLVLSYQVRSPISSFSLPHTFFVQKAVIRGWTGRSGRTPWADAALPENEENRYVYVTDYGTVYHTDPNCTHLKLIINEVSFSDLKNARNISGGRYKPCEHCMHALSGSHSHSHPGEGHLHSSGEYQHSYSQNYYICPFGDSYHCSLDCPGLSRSVNTVKLRDCGGMRECADCKARREAAAAAH